MSLIYQALKQSEQQVSASPAHAPRTATVAPAAGKKPGIRWRNPLGLGVVIAVGGVLAGFLLNQRIQAPSAQVSPQTAQPVPYQPGQAPAPERSLGGTSVQARVTTEAPGALPRAELTVVEPPLPTSGPRLRLAYDLPAETRRTPPPPEDAGKPTPTEVAATQVPAPVATPISNSNNAKPIASTVEIIEKSAAPAQAQPSNDDVRALFEALNQALENRDTPLAQSQLKSIQSRLPASSVARLRAEAWFAHQTGDLDGASRVYRQLLEKMPGDEMTSINLATIERKRQRLEQANEVLAKALRQNPGSKLLRSAIDQLAQSEVRQ